MDLEYIKENLNNDPIWINKMFREACARLIATTPIAEKITVEITRKQTQLFISVNGQDLDKRGLRDAHEGMPSLVTTKIKCENCGYEFEPQKGQEVQECLRCGHAQKWGV